MRFLSVMELAFLQRYKVLLCTELGSGYIHNCDPTDLCFSTASPAQGADKTTKLINLGELNRGNVGGSGERYVLPMNFLIQPYCSPTFSPHFRQLLCLSEALEGNKSNLQLPLHLQIHSCLVQTNLMVCSRTVITAVVTTRSWTMLMSEMDYSKQPISNFILFHYTKHKQAQVETNYIFEKAFRKHQIVCKYRCKVRLTFNEVWPSLSHTTY